MKALAQNTLIQNRYLVVQLIGKGGMGEVYLAVDQRLGSAVALKRTFFAGDEMLGNAFEREARTLARMRHPVLPKVSDHFGENEDQYLVMEHISGEDLGKRLDAAKKPFPISWVLFWADQLLDALSYLHTHEPPIIHRDIKPQNLKLTDENHIILLDFGLSKTSTGQTNISQSGSTGSVVGYTPHYAPMEQIRGIGTSARSDLYSLSATLYQLLTNTVPVDALSRADAMLNEMPDPIQPLYALNPEIPKTVSDVILKGMEVSQDKRHTNAREMQKLLRKAFTEMQQSMAAETVAFSLHDNKTEPIDQPFETSLPRGANVSDGDSIQTALAGKNVATADASSDFAAADVQDFDATIAFDPEPVAVQAKQADIKTEVLGKPVQREEKSPMPSGQPPTPSEAGSISGGFGQTNDRAASDSEAGEYLSDATIPIFAVPVAAAGNASDSATEFYPNAVVVEEREAFTPPPAYNDSRNSEPYQSSVPRPAPAADYARKKSGSRVFAVVGGIAALAVLAAAGAGGGWYYYKNFHAAAIAVEPSPSPEMSVEPTPAAEEVFGSNTADDTSVGNTSISETNSSNSSIDSVVDEPVSVPSAESPNRPPPSTRSTRNLPPPGTRPAPSAKATPKPKKADDRTKILQ